MLKLLLRQPGQTVSAVAGHLNLSLPVASQGLRALEARGLLTLRRAGRTVEYRPSAPTAGETEATQEFIPAIRLAFRQDSDPVKSLFRLATAFTHPRRIEIFRALKKEAGTVAQLKRTTRIPTWTLLRHLKKLEARGFVACLEGTYVTTTPPDAFGRALVRQAAG